MVFLGGFVVFLVLFHGSFMFFALELVRGFYVFVEFDGNLIVAVWYVPETLAHFINR